MGGKQTIGSRSAILLVIAPTLIAQPCRLARYYCFRTVYCGFFRSAEAFGVAIDGDNAAEAGALVKRSNAPAIRAGTPHKRSLPKTGVAAADFVFPAYLGETIPGSFPGVLLVIV